MERSSHVYFILQLTIVSFPVKTNKKKGREEVQSKNGLRWLLTDVQLLKLHIITTW